MSKEIGSIGRASFTPSTASSERGGMRTSGVSETKANNLSSYKPMFSISKDGNTSRLGGDTMKRNTYTDNKLSSVTSFRGESSYFSQDRLAPKMSSFETVLYQRPTSEKSVIPQAEKKKFVIPELKHMTTVSDKDGKVTPKAIESIYKKPGVDRESTKEIRKTLSWTPNQTQFAEQRFAAKDQVTSNSSGSNAERKLDHKTNPFTSKFQQRLTTVQNMQTQQSIKKEINPTNLQSLEVKISRDLPSHSNSSTQKNKELVEQIQQTVTPEVGKINLDHQSEIRGVTQVLTKEQAHLEIATKLQDGAKVASNMIKILESQGIEPQLARKVAIEKVTQTLVKTLKEKHLDQHLRNDDEQPRVDNKITQTKPTIEVKKYLDAQGHQIREKTTTDQFDNITIDREEIIAERDIIADANRIEMATHIGNQLLNRAYLGGSSNIHTREVAELMPEEPGETLASFIRTQLNLLLNSEEQYDFFKDALARAGYVSTEYDVTKAAKYATDSAPAVRLTRKLTTEKVLQRDEERAINRGDNFSLK